jgi:hypothetical protein
MFIFYQMLKKASIHVALLIVDISTVGYSTEYLDIGINQSDCIISTMAQNVGRGNPNRQLCLDMKLLIRAAR